MLSRKPYSIVIATMSAKPLRKAINGFDGCIFMAVVGGGCVGPFDVGIGGDSLRLVPALRFWSALPCLENVGRRCLD